MQQSQKKEKQKTICRKSSVKFTNEKLKNNNCKIFTKINFFFGYYANIFKQKNII